MEPWADSGPGRESVDSARGAAAAEPFDDAEPVAKPWQPRNNAEKLKMSHLERRGIETVTSRLLSPDDVALPRAPRPSHVPRMRGVLVDEDAERARVMRLERMRAQLALPVRPLFEPRPSEPAPPLPSPSRAARPRPCSFPLTRSLLPRDLAQARCALDGFLLLDACGVEFPDEGHRADVSGCNADSVVREDLAYFTRLTQLDASDNALPLEPFGVLPKLKSLRLPCNGVRTLEQLTGGFARLLQLDLSYNQLEVDAVARLAALPALRELDLTSNALSALPPPKAMRRFASLERLTLEHNRLEGDEPLLALAACPLLDDVSLAYNYVTRVPAAATGDVPPGGDAPAPAAGAGDDAAGDVAADGEVPPGEYSGARTGGFRSLLSLNLAFNYIAEEGDVMAVSVLPKLETLVLYGNPLLGPTGEDPTGGSVERCARAAAASRDGWTERPLELVTEAPRKRATAGTVSAARANATRRRGKVHSTAIRLVDAEALPTAAQFRAAGNRALMRDDAGARSGEQLAGPDSLQQWGTHSPVPRSPPAPPAADGTDVFLTGVSDAGPDSLDELGDGDGALSALPAQLLSRSMEPGRRSDPAKLRCAISALRFALKHPLTAHTDVPQPRRGGNVPYATRTTAAASARQLPRRPFELRPRRGGHGLGGAAVAGQRGGSLGAAAGAMGGAELSVSAGESFGSVVSRARSLRQHKEGALAEIEHVIDNMNERMAEFEKRREAGTAEDM